MRNKAILKLEGITVQREVIRVGVLFLHFEGKSVPFTQWVFLQFELIERRGVACVSTHSGHFKM